MTSKWVIRWLLSTNQVHLQVLFFPSLSLLVFGGFSTNILGKTSSSHFGGTPDSSEKMWGSNWCTSTCGNSFYGKHPYCYVSEAHMFWRKNTSLQCTADSGTSLRKKCPLAKKASFWPRTRNVDEAFCFFLKLSFFWGAFRRVELVVNVVSSFFFKAPLQNFFKFKCMSFRIRAHFRDFQKWSLAFFSYPPKTNMFPKKGTISNGNFIWTNHWFSVDMLASGSVMCSFLEPETSVYKLVVSIGWFQIIT